MRIAALVASWFVKLAGIVQLGLGIAIWTGRGASLVPAHISLGFLIVLALWVLAILALVAGVQRGLAVFALLWGVALPALGMPQATILMGSWHWIIRVVHLVMGLAALGIADRLGSAVIRHRATPVAMRSAA